MNEHYEKYKEGYKQRAKDWAKRNPERANETNRKWRAKNKERMKSWNCMSKEKQNEYSKTKRDKIRKEILELLGNRCSNPHCLVLNGCSDIRCLQIDHVNGKGNQERKLFKNHAYKYLRHILQKIREGSKDYQLLCANCNVIKRAEKKE
jgi:hypothetical protein